MAMAGPTVADPPPLVSPTNDPWMVVRHARMVISGYVEPCHYLAIVAGWLI
jgi:hypothetical protein